MVETSNDERVPFTPGSDRMQRVRVGVTGLAAVLLIVLLATAIATGVRHSAGTEGNNVLAPSPTVAAAPGTSNGVDANAEPLAQLGAAPGGKPSESNSQTTKR